MMLLVGVLPRIPLKLRPRLKTARPSRNFDIYFAPILSELDALFREGVM